METLNKFHGIHYWRCCSNNNEEKWKIFLQSRTPFSSSFHFLMLIQLLIFCTKPVTSQVLDGVLVTQADFQALQAFKQELIDPKGFLRSWNDSGYGACSGGWAGIKCAQGQVIVIQLPWKGLSGRITVKIGQLQGLRKLSLHDNLIGGSIPQSLGLLPKLRGLQLFSNRFSGSIPPSLGNCPFLQTLDLGNNSLVGTIPESLANSSKLFRLNASFNSLSGPIPGNLTRSSSLIFLALQYNHLSGSIPASFGNSSLLREVTLSHNQISGPLPGEIGKLSRLRILDMSNNAIDGTLPVSLSKLSSLVLLNLENNKIDGQIPEGLGNLHNLSVLNLKKNQINGRVPEAIGNISTLTQLELSLNDLGGGIPNSLANLSNLNSFNVSYNNLSGPVPTPLAQKFNSSSFVGNIELCGFIGGAPCPSEAPSRSVPAPPPEVPKKKAHKFSNKDIILVAAGALLIVLVILCFILLCCLIRKKAALSSRSGQPPERAAAARGKRGAPPVAGEVEAGGDTGGKLVSFDGPIVFTADDLLCATADIMGKSTYGTVYKATFEDGNQVAVKRLRERVAKGQREFEAEVNVLGKIRHPNLLALRAYYLGPKGEKLLVFDYLTKGSLSTFLHSRGPETQIDWPTRMRIIKGTTRGLLHLHGNENIIHGHLTSSNVLLDEQTNAKIADYGLSRLMTAATNTNVIATAGASGYSAPELSKLKKANSKTDVYSLGVIILELLTGKSPSEVMNGVDLPQWVASIFKEEWTNEVFDLELTRDAFVIGDELTRTLKLALRCVDPSPSARPEVQQVLLQLEDIRPEAAASSSGLSGDDGAGEVPSTSE